MDLPLLDREDFADARRGFVAAVGSETAEPIE
jgi:alkyl sulfatase BDS1-like metallo-beta-lactamase superfamily hydrolase